MKPFHCLEYQRHTPEWEQALRLRERELRTPLGLTYSADDLAAEADEWHFAAAEEGEIIASLNMKPVMPGVWKMRQVVVDPAWRGLGIGAALVNFSEAAARRHGISEITLHARAAVVAFYQKLGYTAEGPEFIEVTLPHRRMRRRL